MSDKYVYRDIQTADRGKGYLAVNVLAIMVALQAAIHLLVTLSGLTFSVSPDSASRSDNIHVLYAAFVILTEFPAIVVLRLLLRALLVMRDRAAHEIIDQDARYKTSSSST